MLDVILEKLSDQLAEYESMARKEREETGGETHATCVYLEGAVVASRRALETVQRVQDDVD